MGTFDGRDTCDLVGVYNLKVLSEKYQKEEVDLYRDNGWECLENLWRPQAEKVSMIFNTFLFFYFFS